jgi:hypothetical protein
MTNAIKMSPIMTTRFPGCARSNDKDLAHLSGEETGDRVNKFARYVWQRGRLPGSPNNFLLSFLRSLVLRSFPNTMPEAALPTRLGRTCQNAFRCCAEDQNGARNPITRFADEMVEPCSASPRHDDSWAFLGGEMRDVRVLVACAVSYLLGCGAWQLCTFGFAPT